MSRMWCATNHTPLNPHNRISSLSVLSHNYLSTLDAETVLDFEQKILIWLHCKSCPGKQVYDRQMILKKFLLTFTKIDAKKSGYPLFFNCWMTDLMLQKSPMMLSGHSAYCSFFPMADIILETEGFCMAGLALWRPLCKQTLYFMYCWLLYSWPLYYRFTYYCWQNECTITSFFKIADYFPQLFHALRCTSH